MPKGRHIHKGQLLATCPGLPLPVGDAVPPCGLWAAHFPHPFNKSARFRTAEGS